MICRNKLKLLSNNFPGVYQLDCSSNVLCIDETKKKDITGTIEQQQDNFNGKWESSGASEHCLECYRQLNWANPKTLSAEQQYHRRKIRESLEIKKSKNEQKKKSFESRRRKSCQDKHVNSTYCHVNWNRNQHKDLTSNLKMVFNSILYFNHIWKQLWLTKPKYCKVI